MSRRIAAKITGVAGYVPPKVLTNADLEKMVDTNDEWIRTRTGISERHIAENGTASSHLATGHVFSGDSMPRAGPAGSEACMGIRSVRGVFWLCVCADRWSAVRGFGSAPQGIGDWQ